MATYKGYLQDKDGNILLPDKAKDFLVLDTLTVGNIESKNLWQNSDYLTNSLTGGYVIENGGFTFTRGDIAGGKYIAKKIKVEKDKTYTFSALSNNFGTNYFYICIYRTNVYGTLVKSTIANFLRYTATATEELFFTFIIGSAITSVSVSNIQVEQGSSITSYYSYFKIPTFDEIYPIGAIYLSVDNTNPSKLFGGTWEQIAKGRTLVGVDTSDTDFNTVKKTGGKKTHTLTIDEMPSHNHTTNGNKAAIAKWAYEITTVGTFAVNNSSGYIIGEMDKTGNGKPHNNLQPYFTCYIWCRTA